MAQNPKEPLVTVTTKQMKNYNDKLSFFSTMIPIVYCLIIFWEKPVLFPVKKERIGKGASRWRQSTVKSSVSGFIESTTTVLLHHLLQFCVLHIKYLNCAAIS